MAIHVQVVDCPKRSAEAKRLSKDTGGVNWGWYNFVNIFFKTPRIVRGVLAHAKLL